MQWTKTSDYQQIRVVGNTTMTIEQMDDWWFWSVHKTGGRYVCGDDTGDYAHTEIEAKILAEINAI